MISIYAMAVETFVPMLGDLSKIIDKAAQHAGAKQLDASALLDARLTPDMYPFVRQVQIACDQAKSATARLMGQEPPRFEDNERTLDELQARVAKTLDYLKRAPVSAFDGVEDRQMEIPLTEDRVLATDGFHFLKDWALPHFYFHLVTAYDILRHSGVDIGKRDYVGHVGAYIRKREPEAQVAAQA